MLADSDPRSGLTDWERAAEDIDLAEWALLEALDAGEAGRVWEADRGTASIGCQSTGSWLAFGSASRLPSSPRPRVASPSRRRCAAMVCPHLQD